MACVWLNSLTGFKEPYYPYFELLTFILSIRVKPSFVLTLKLVTSSAIFTYNFAKCKSFTQRGAVP